MVLALLLAAAACPGTKVEVHGRAERAGRLDVYAAPGEVETSTAMLAGQPWTVCVSPTTHPIDPRGPYSPWFDEVHYSFADGTAKHERWAVPRDVKSVSVDKVRTDGVLK